jgi:hypothetical protein
MHSSTAVRNADEADFGVDPEGVPHAYRRAVTEFASQLNLDADALVQGGRLDSGGLGFWLQHYGKRDPKAITVFVDLGQLPSEPELQLAVYRQLLEKNVTSPGGLCGYHGVVPESSTCVMCIRLDLEKVDSEGNALGRLIATLIDGVQKTREVMGLVLDELVKTSAGKPLQKV